MTRALITDPDMPRKAAVRTDGGRPPLHRLQHLHRALPRSDPDRVRAESAHGTGADLDARRRRGRGSGRRCRRRAGRDGGGRRGQPRRSRRRPLRQADERLGGQVALAGWRRATWSSRPAPSELRAPAAGRRDQARRARRRRPGGRRRGHRSPQGPARTRRGLPWRAPRRCRLGCPCGASRRASRRGRRLGRRRSGLDARRCSPQRATRSRWPSGRPPSARRFTSTAQHLRGPPLPRRHRDPPPPRAVVLGGRRSVPQCLRAGARNGGPRGRRRLRARTCPDP